MADDNRIICKSGISDSFLLYLIKETCKPENVKSYEHQYLQNNKKFKLTKHLVVELYLGLQRLINRNKIKKWRKYSNSISKRDRHEGYRQLIAKLIYELIIKLCDITNNNNNNNNNDDDDKLINKMYDDIRDIHNQSSLQNTKTRISYLKEEYILGASNINFNTIETQKHFKYFQEMSQRNGLSNDENPFKPFKFSLDIQLLLNQKRKQCVYCGKKSHLYCPYCKVPFPIDIDIDNNKFIHFPMLQELPINVDIIRHPKEMVNVCSSVHGCIMAPNHVKMYQFPDIPQLDNQNGVYLLYPSEKSTFLDEMDLSKVKKIIVIESRWRGNQPIYDHKQLKNLPHCKIRNRQTLYWRYQEKSLEHLATIEAIYYGIIDCWKAKNKQKQYKGQYDDLLMLFAHDHTKIRQQSNNKQKKQSFWTV